MAVSTLTIEIRVAWWFVWLYLPGVRFALACCHVAGLWWVEPDMDRVKRMLDRAITIRGPAP